MADVETLLATPITWEHTGDGEHPYRATIDDNALTIRIGDFPDEALYTLIVDGMDLVDLDDWPAAWVKPAMPQALLDLAAATTTKKK